MFSLGGKGNSLPAWLLGATISGVAGIATMLLIRNTTKLRDDVAMGFVLSVFFGVGVASLRMVQTLPGASAAGRESFIYGKTAGMVQSDFLLIALVAAVASLVSILFLKEFLILCFDDGYAAAQGWPTIFLDVLLLGLVTAVTVIGLQSVGLILVIAFLITPPTAARFWTQRLLPMLLISALIGGASGWLGAVISALTPQLPAGAVIVLVAAALFLIRMLVAPPRGVLPRERTRGTIRRRGELTHDGSTDTRSPSRRSTTQRLFAGISSTSCNRIPCAAARSVTTPRSRTPHCGSWDFSHPSKASLLGAVCWPSRV